MNFASHDRHDTLPFSQLTQSSTSTGHSINLRISPPWSSRGRVDAGNGLAPYASLPHFGSPQVGQIHSGVGGALARGGVISDPPQRDIARAATNLLGHHEQSQ